MHVQTIFESAIASISAINCRPQKADRGAIEAPGFHSLAFVRRGAYKYHRGNKAVIVDPLTAIFFAEGDEYSVSHPFGCGDDCLDFWIEDELMREARPAIRPAEGKSHTDARSRVLPVSNEIRCDCSLLARQAELNLVTKLQVEEAALKIVGAVGAIENALVGFEKSVAPGCVGSRAQRKVEQTKEILLSDLGRNWSLKEVAALVDASPFHLTRLVHKFTGATLHQFLTRQRLAVALARVLDGEVSFTALALDLGFSSHSHFSASFKKEFGQTPKSLRKKTRRES